MDEGENSISRIKRDLTQRQLVVELGMLGVEGIAVDWIAGRNPLGLVACWMWVMTAGLKDPSRRG